MNDSLALLPAFLRLLAPALLALLPALHAAAAQPQVVATFAVHAGQYERMDVPVAASLEGVAVPFDAGATALYEVTGGRDAPVAAQRLAGDPGRLAWILAGRTPPGRVRVFEWRLVDAAAPRPTGAPAVRVDDDGEQLRIDIGERPVLAYRYAVQPAPDSVDARYARGGYLHPLWSPEGEVLTRIQPPDHYHHYGIWNPWTRTDFEGRQVDFWNLGDGQGTVRARQVFERTAGPVFGGFRAVHDHVDLSAPRGEKTALNEQWDVRAWSVDPEARVWLVDFVSTQSPVAAPLTVKAYRYQGFTLRATETWNDETATLLTSEGFDKSDANATRARWIDVSGVSGAAGGTSGVLLMSHPANHNFPEHLRVWPTGTNGGVENVFVNFNPAQEQDWMLAPGGAYTLKYRLLVYDGRLDRADAERYWNDFAHPPVVDAFPTGDP